MSDRHLTRAIVLLGALITLAWSVLAYLIGPALVESMYRGESVAFLNAVIEGRDVHPLSEYLGRWSRIAHLGVVLILGATAGTLVFTRAGVQTALDRVHGQADLHEAAIEASRSVHPMRRYIVNSWLLLVIGGTFVSVIRAKESWPFSHYDMYSAVRTENDFVRFNLFGVVDDSTEVELDYPRQLPPFDVPRLHTALLRIKLWRGEQHVEPALEAVARLYEQRRREGAHDGPSLRALRYYRLEWDVDARVRNRDRPRERSLVAEVVLDD